MGSGRAVSVAVGGGGNVAVNVGEALAVGDKVAVAVAVDANVAEASDVLVAMPIASCACGVLVEKSWAAATETEVGSGV